MKLTQQQLWEVYQDQPPESEVVVRLQRIIERQNKTQEKLQHRLERQRIQYETRIQQYVAERITYASIKQFVDVAGQMLESSQIAIKSAQERIPKA